VIGSITNYRVTYDPKERAKWCRINGISSAKKCARQNYMSDYARFDIIVDKVLRGPVAKRLTVTWDNSTFGEPEKMAPGPYVIALRRSGKAQPPLRGPSATVFPTPQPNLFTVLQAPCAPPFILQRNSPEAIAVRRLLRK
ncbi:MAG: hypothetical protein ACKVOP_12360, partial [Sphingomonadaceae bacterium]